MASPPRDLARGHGPPVAAAAVSSYRHLQRPRPSDGWLGGGWRAGRYFGMERIAAGRAHCALCGEAIRPGEDALVTPDFIANESDPLWRFADAPMHRACFLVWDRRKSFIATYNRLARRMLAPDGSHPLMTGEGEIVRRASGSRPPGGPAV